MISLPEWTSRWVNKLKHHGLFLLGAYILVLYSYPAWVLPGKPGTDDLSNLNIPQRQLLGWFYQHGHWPLWNPFNFAGQPLLAAGQSGPLYLPNIVFAILPIVAALKVSYVFHLLLLTVGMYCLAWSMTKHRWAALLATIAFADCGFFLGHQIHTQMFDAMCWLPLNFWMFLRLQEKFTRRRLGAMALTFGGQIFAGHPQVIFYTVLFSVLYAFIMWCWEPSWQGIRRILWGLSGMALGALVAGAQLLPTLQLIGYSDRSNVSNVFLLLGSMFPAGLLQYLLPFTAGGGYTLTPFSITRFTKLYYAANFWEFLPYIGLVFLCFAVATGIARFMADRVVRTLSIIAVFSLLLSLGSFGFLPFVLTDVPGFDLFRVPARYVGVADFAFALLLAIGIRHLSQTDRSTLLRKVFFFVPPVLIVMLLILRLCGVTAGMVPAAFWVPIGQLVLIFLLALYQIRLPSRWPTVVLSLLGIVGLVFQTVSLSSFVDWESGAYATSNPLVAYLKSHMTGTYPFTRVASLGATPLQMDRAASWLIPSVNGYDSLVSKWYVNKINLTWTNDTFLNEPRQFIDALGVKYVVTDVDDSRSLSTGTGGTTKWMHWVPSLRGAYALRITLSPMNTMTDGFSPLFSVTLISGKHVFTQQIAGWPAPSYVINLPHGWPKNAATQVIIRSQNWTGTYTIKSLQILRSTRTTTMDIDELFGARPWKRVTTINGITVWKNPDTLHPAWIATKQSPLHPLSTSATLVSWEPNQQTWRVQTKTSGLFVLSQAYDPSWSATVDGHSVPVQQTAGLLTSVAVGKGAHTIKLTYKPRSFQAGLGISVIALLFSILLFTLPDRESLWPEHLRRHHDDDKDE